MGNSQTIAKGVESLSSEFVHHFIQLNSRPLNIIQIVRDNISVPDRGRGLRKHMYHFQSVTRTAQGGFAMSASTREKPYVLLTSPLDKSTAIPIATIVPDIQDYNRAGGLQTCGNYLAVGIERVESGPKGDSIVLFYDISDTSMPHELCHLAFSRQGDTAEAVGICRQGDKYWVVVGNWNCTKIDIYESSSVNLHSETTFFIRRGNWSKHDGLSELSVNRKWRAYQNLNLFPSNNCDGEFWLVGMHQDRHNMADVYLVKVPKSGKLSLVKQAQKEFDLKGTGMEKLFKAFKPSFEWGSGVIWDPDRNSIQMYAIERNFRGASGRIRIAEWDRRSERSVTIQKESNGKPLEVQTILESTENTFEIPNETL